MYSREDYVYLAKLAEQTERYEEMVKYIQAVAAMNKDLTLEERNLLSVAYKNVIGARRAAWRVVSTQEAKGEAKQHGEKFSPELLKDYKKVIETELTQTCSEILDTLELNLIPSTEEGENKEEAKVFFFKMKGDYHRYIAEINLVPVDSGLMLPDPESKDAKNSEEAYKKAQEFAAAKLQSTHPIRLGLALNFSVFHFEIKRNSAEACKHAKDAFDAAIAELDTLSEESYKDSTLIMQLLRDNLTLWSNEDKGDTVVVQDIEQDD